MDEELWGTFMSTELKRMCQKSCDLCLPFCTGCVKKKIYIYTYILYLFNSYSLSLQNKKHCRALTGHYLHSFVAQLNQWHEVSLHVTLQTLDLIALVSILFRPKITVLNRHRFTMRRVSGVINTGAGVGVCGGSSAAEPVLLVDFSSQVAPAAHVGLKVTMSRRRTLSVRQLNVIKGHVSWMSGAGLHTFNRYLTHNNNT